MKPLSLILALALLTSCGKEAPDAGAGSAPATDAAAPSGEAVPSPAGSAGGNSAAKTTPVPKGPVTPRQHSKLLGLIDFSKVPPFEGAVRQEHTVVSASISLVKKDAGDVRRCVAHFEKALKDQGWTPAAGHGDSPWAETGGVSYHQKDGAIVMLSVGVSQGSAPGAQDVNAGIFLQGEVDARVMPQPSGSKAGNLSFSAAQFTSPLDVAGVRKFYSEKLPALGWVEYGLYLPGGMEVPKEQAEAFQYFIQNGVSLLLWYNPKGAETAVLLRTEVLSFSPPVAARADFVRMQTSPPLMMYAVKMSPEDAIAWCIAELEKDGWKGGPTKAPEEKTIAHRFERPGSKPLLLEVAKAGNEALVRMREVE